MVRARAKNGPSVLSTGIISWLPVRLTRYLRVAAGERAPAVQLEAASERRRLAAAPLPRKGGGLVLRLPERVASAACVRALAIVRRYVDDPLAYLQDRRNKPRALIRVTPKKIVSWKP